MADKTLPERMRTLETYFAIVFGVAVFFGISGIYLASLVKDATVTATKAQELARDAEKRLSDATTKSVDLVNASATTSVSQEIERRLGPAMESQLKMALDRLRAEIPNSVVVKEAEYTNWGGLNQPRRCKSRVVSGVSLGANAGDLVAFCSELSLKRTP